MFTCLSGICPTPEFGESDGGCHRNIQRFDGRTPFGIGRYADAPGHFFGCFRRYAVAFVAHYDDSTSGERGVVDVVAVEECAVDFGGTAQAAKCGGVGRCRLC